MHGPKGGQLLTADAAEPDTTDAAYKDLFEEGPDAVVVVDAAGLIHLVNQAAVMLFGYAREELVGQPLDMLVPDRLRAAHAGHRADYLANPVRRSVDAPYEPAGRRKDGTEFPVGISLSSVETDDGILVSAALRDITTGQHIEEKRGQREAIVVKARRDEEQEMLETQLRQAQRLESIGQLAGGVAHDFNNLLAGIMNYAGLVAATLQEETTRRGLANEEAFVTLAQDVGEITNVAKRAAALTRQLLIFSQRTVVQPEVLDLNSVVRDLEILLRTTIGENVSLRTVFEPDLGCIKADRGQIDQIFMNLAVNARDAMPGGGELAIETATVEVDEHYAELHGLTPGTYVRLTVSDTGIGMSPEVVARTFEPFFTTKPKGVGSGLGLATVYGIVTQAGGDVVILSAPGEGTTIRIHLPGTTEARSELRDLKRATPLVANGETVLLVEDEAIVREPVRRTLARNGYAVLSAENADDALVIVGEHRGPIHLLLTDVVMPGRSGKELSVEVLLRRPGTKVLFMSGYSQDVIAHQGVLEEGVNLIEKPFSADDLLRKVRSVLDGET